MFIKGFDGAAVPGYRSWRRLRTTGSIKPKPTSIRLPAVRLAISIAVAFTPVGASLPGSKSFVMITVAIALSGAAPSFATTVTVPSLGA